MRLRTTTISILAIGLLAGSAVGVAAQGDSSPAFFSWTYGDGEAEFVSGEMEESVAGAMTMRDFTQVFSIEADDGRASGLSTYAFNSDSWGDADADAPEMIDVITFSQRIVNEGGSWSGTGTLVDRHRPRRGRRAERRVDGDTGRRVWLRRPDAVPPSHSRRRGRVGLHRPDGERAAYPGASGRVTPSRRLGHRSRWRWRPDITR